MQKGHREVRGNAARLFGYDVFVSFALGAPPRGSRSYASDLARRLRDRDFTVFFSEDEAPVGDHLDSTLRHALHRSRILVVIANSGTLADPRWVREEVEEFRRKHPGRPVIPINIGHALQDPALGPAAETWLRFSDKIWIDEPQSAGDEGVVSDSVIERLVSAPYAMRSRARWRWTVRAAFAVLSIVTASALWFAWSDRQNAGRAAANAAQSQLNATRAATNASRARTNEAEAKAKAAEARRESERAVAAEEQARKEEAAARMAERRARSGQLAAESQLARPFDARLALLLAREAWMLDPTMEARRALFATLDEPVAIPLDGPDWLEHDADGRIVSAHRDGDRSEIILMDPQTHRTLTRLPEPQVRKSALSPDRRTLATVNATAELRLWDLRTGAAIGAPMVPPEMVGSWRIVWNPDGRTIAQCGLASDDSRRIVFWDVKSQSAVAQLRVDGKHGNIEFSPDGTRLAANMGEEIQVWDVETRAPIASVPANGQLFGFLDNDHIAFQGPGYVVTRWRLGEQTATEPPFSGLAARVTAFAHAPAAGLVATGAKDESVRLWRDYSAEMLRVLPHDGHDTDRLTFSNDGRRLIVQTRAGFREWLLNTASHRFRRTEPHASSSRLVSTSDNGRWVVGSGSRLEWRDLETGRILASSDASERLYVQRVARDGTVLAGDTDRMYTYARGASQPRCSFSNQVDDAAFSADGTLLVTTHDDDPSLRFWSVRDCSAVAAIPRPQSRHTLPPFAFSADGRSLLVAGRGQIRRWNISERRFEATPLMPDTYTSVLAVDDQGRFVAAGQMDGAISLQRLGSNEPPVSLRGPHGFAEIQHLAFSPDGLWLASTAEDDRVVLWDLSSNQAAGPPIVTGLGRLRDIAFTSDSRTLITAGVGGYVLWNVDAEAWSAESCRVAQRNLTCAEWRRMFGALPYRKTCPAFPPPGDLAGCRG